MRDTPHFAAAERGSDALKRGGGDMGNNEGTEGRTSCG